MAPPSRGTFNSTERDLGLDVPITRRDFLDSTLLAAGAAVLQLPPPQGRSGATLSAADWQGYGGIGDYASSNGNTWEAVTTAHRLRDRQLGGADAAKQAVDTGERYDLIVVGGGLSGLAAAFFFMKGRRQAHAFDSAQGELSRARQPSGRGRRGEAQRVHGRRRAPDRAARLERFRHAAARRVGRRLLAGARAAVRRGCVRAPGLERGHHAARNGARALLLPTVDRRLPESRLLLQAARRVADDGSRCVRRGAGGDAVVRVAAS